MGHRHPILAALEAFWCAPPSALLVFIAFLFFPRSS